MIWIKGLNRCLSLALLMKETKQLEKITDLPEVIDKLYYIKLYLVYLSMCWNLTNNLIEIFLNLTEIFLNLTWNILEFDLKYSWTWLRYSWAWLKYSWTWLRYSWSWLRYSWTWLRYSEAGTCFIQFQCNSLQNDHFYGSLMDHDNFFLIYFEK
jgi:hypothetical protein